MALKVLVVLLYTHCRAIQREEGGCAAQFCAQLGKSIPSLQ